MAEQFSMPSMFDTRYAMDRQMELDAQKAGQVGGGGKRYGMYYNSSLLGDRDNASLMSLTGMMGGQGDPRMAKQNAIDTIMQQFPNPESAEDFKAIAGALNAQGLYDESARAMAMANDITEAQPKVNKPATSIEEFQFYVDSGGKDDYMTFLTKKKGSGTTVNVGDDQTITKDGLKLVEDLTTKSGFRYVEIEGGEAWTATQKRLQDEAANEISEKQRLGSGLSTKTQTEFVMNREIDSAIDYITNQSIGAPVTGKAAELFMTAPDVITANSDAQGLRANILTIQGIIGFERLQRMRAESETGGALGQVAVQELIALQGTLGNLNLLAPKEDILERLRDIKDIYNRNMDIIRDNYTPEDLARFGFDLSGKDNLEPSRLDLIAAELARRNL